MFDFVFILQDEKRNLPNRLGKKKGNQKTFSEISFLTEHIINEWMSATQQWNLIPQKVIRWMLPPWMLKKGFPSLARGVGPDHL